MKIISIKKELTQCKKCQIWGHATSNCYLKYMRCVKCAGEHRFYECEKSREVPAVCANCGKDHPASSLKYEVYVKHLEDKNQKAVKHKLITSSKAVKKPTYVDAPQPTVNAWHRRTQQSENLQPVTAGTSANTSHSSQEMPQQARTESRGTPDLQVLESTSNSLKAIESIADIMNDIRKMCDLQWLASVLSELRAEMAKWRNLVEYAVAVDNFNSKYQHKLRCP